MIEENRLALSIFVTNLGFLYKQKANKTTLEKIKIYFTMTKEKKNKNDVFEEFCCDRFF